MSDDWIGRPFLMFWWICPPHLPFQSKLSTPCTHISFPPCPAEKRRKRLSKFNHWKMLRLLLVWRTSAGPDLSLVVSFCWPKHQWEHRDCPVCAAVPVLVLSWFRRSLAFPLPLVSPSATNSYRICSEGLRSCGLSPPNSRITFAVF